MDRKQFNTLITARFSKEALAPIADRLGSVRYSGFGVSSKKLTEDELIGSLQDTQFLISEFEPVTEKVLDACRDLALIACCRTGPEASVDVEAATRRGIPVLYTPGRNAVSVAEFTFALMLNVARHAAEVHHLLKYTEELTQVSYEDKPGDRTEVTSEWSLDPDAPFNHFQGPELDGKVLGLVGFGAIGREIAARARAFGMTILAFDPYVSKEQAASLGAEVTNLKRVAAESDFLVMAAKVTEETRGLFSREMFARMRPSAFFVNTARAALVDYDALYDTLREGRIAGAALDVYPKEPIPSDSPFRTLSNVVLTPHLAGASTDIPRHHSRIIVEAIAKLLAGEKPGPLKNPEVLGSSLFSERFSLR